VGAVQRQARQTKSKSRLGRYEEMAAEADRMRKIDTSEINIPAGPRLGDIVLEAHDLEKGFEDRTLMHNLSFSLPRAGIVGVIGPNGVGKTTLFRMITGEEKPDNVSSRSVRRSRSPTSTRAAAASTRRRTSGRSSPTVWTSSRSPTSR
jgi:ATPase subunit of ABC transporter with duplicated ATPase domains